MPERSITRLAGASDAEVIARIYNQGIAEEYSGKLPGFLFRLNRRRFLKGLLARERIYLSDWFHQRYEEAARRNLLGVLGN